ncbi:MAG TPA: sulfate ABC transporter ATP-binding protein [bacterium]|jgi:sulfate transport system ATP-binding protein|nr:sulfate ABC transporter ATP-binding protein [bacterium]HXB97225.1 sulfate ABC transporter ATP-binding protein [bacterium]
MSIEVKGITKRFGAFTAVENIHLDMPSGDLVALLGPSGSGKSTLLRIIAGLETPDEGEVHLTGREATGLSARERNVGFVFQHYALFKHMTVARNIGFGLEVRKVPQAQIDRKVSELLGLIQLQGLGGRYPGQLSGGQRQRVAVARALAPEPQVLLLDEPFGALDAKVRAELRAWVRRLHDATGMTTLFVTHDQDEAMEVANRVVIMDHGRIVQEGSPRAIFDKPATQFVAEFVGESNRIEAEAAEDGLVVWGPLRFAAAGVKKGQLARIYFRPHNVYVTGQLESLQVPAQIVGERFKGAFTELEMDLGAGRRLLAHLPRGLSEASGFKVGDSVWAGVTGYHVF